MSSARAIIDENGDLFGVVNVIDAFVAVAVLTVVVAGVGLVLSGDAESDPPELGSTYVTLDMGNESAYILEAISDGDTYNPTANSRLTITDVYASAVGNRSDAVVRAELRGPTDGDTVRYADGVPRLGRVLEISTNRYSANGTIIAVGQRETLPIETTDVLIRDTISTTSADTITEGDAMTVGGESVARVETVTTYATRNPERSRVFVGLSLDTRPTAEPQFGGVALQQDRNFSFRTANYSLVGTIERVGALEQRGTETNRTVTLGVTNVSTDRAGTFEQGMTEQSGGETVANVTDVTVEPTTVVTTADDGSVRAVDHPYLRDVTLTAELSVRETASGVRFKGDVIQQGSTVVVDFGTVTVQAEVVSLGP